MRQLVVALALFSTALLVSICALAWRLRNLEGRLVEAVELAAEARRRLEQHEERLPSEHEEWPPSQREDRTFLRAQLAQTANINMASALFAPLQIASLTSQGAIPMPPDVEHVLMEIGCSDRHTLDDVLGQRPRAFLIAFEPLLDKYAVLLARGTKRYHGTKADRSVPLAHHHERGVVLPLAVAGTAGMHNFSVASIAGCSSLSTVNVHAGWAPWCRRQIESRLVPSITLSAALRLSGALPVRELKIDAQGVDFAIVQSARPALLRRKVESIELEVRASDCQPLYHGQAGCDEVVAYMASIGFHNSTRCPSKYWHNPFEYVRCERRLVFKRQSRPLRASAIL